MTLKRLYRRFRDFGGFKLLKEYACLGVLTLSCKELVAILARSKTPMEGYSNIMARVGQNLQCRYLPVMNELDNQYSNDHEIGKHSNKIWVCWLQGMENAPLLVQVCYASLCKNLAGREVILLTEDNIKDYVCFPDFIEEKHRKGLIPMPHYTDLLRLELLIRYGGTWIDATVLCTEANTDNMKLTDMLDADLFLFQQLRKGETRFLGISNWFITSASDHWVLKILRDMLYQYWREYDCVVHYYIFHLFFGMIMEKHPEVTAKMPRHGNNIPHYLSRRMGDKYDDEWMQELKKCTCFHKLSYRLKDGVENSQGTFYDKIIKGECGNFS